MRRHPRVLLLIAVIIWGWTFVATKILLAEIGPVELFALRLAIGLPFLGGVLVIKRVPLGLDRTDIGPLLLGGVMLAGHFLIQAIGLVTATAINTSWIITVSPLALAILSFAFHGDRLSRSAEAGMVLATIGILLLVSRGHLTDLAWLQSTGDWLVLVSAFTWAIYTVVTRDLVRRRNPLSVTFAILAIAAALMGLLWILTVDRSGVTSLSPLAIGALIFLAVPGLAMAHWFWQEGVSALGAARAGVYLYLEPIATLFLAVPVLGEEFTTFVAMGGGLVLAGVYLGQRENRATPDGTETPP